MPKRFNPVAFIILIRPGNVALTALAVWIGGMMAHSDWQTFANRIVFAVISAALIAAGGNAYNDYCDRELDRWQKSTRPLPAGRISPRAALWWSNLCLLLGILVATRLGTVGLAMAAWVGMLLVLYSRHLKRQPLTGNLVIALISALPFIYGGIAVYTVEPVLWAAVLAFFFHLGREIIKDMEDVEGDRAAGADTLPIRYGMKTARLCATFSFLFLLVSLPLPYYMGGFGIEYAFLVLFGVAPVLIAVSLLIWRLSQPHQLHRLAWILKLDMLAGMLALYLGRPLP